MYFAQKNIKLSFIITEDPRFPSSMFASMVRARPSISRSLVLHRNLIQFYSSSSSSSSRTLSSSIDSHQDCNKLNRINHRDWLAPNEVLKIFKTIQDPETLISALNKVSKRKDYKPNTDLYILVINKFAQVKKFDAIDDIMKRIEVEKSCRLSDEFFYDVIKIYGNVCGRINKAIETLFDMPKFNVWPTVKTFNFVLNLLVSTKQFDVIHEVYIAAPKLGLEIDTCCLNILIKGLCECGNTDAAFQVLDEFPKQKCRPNARTFSTLMHGLCEQGKVDEAFGLFERMESEGIYPDTITFNILISGLRKKGRIEEGVELLERMKLKGCNPNSGSYQQVLYGLLETDKYVEAKDFMCKMISKGMCPSFVSYRMIIDGLCKQNLVEDVCSILEQMVRQGFVPKMGMWRHILQRMFPRNGSNAHYCMFVEDVIES